ncbi:hypothetical protein I302_100832 [Kwoniella bestiolae CBS 10118]|uniref:Uncharacterized protein n=1 Tax=Kwoniella bestiolae CBS 10118 TaxID=1296100 RepID=A0A1B9G660_9TREE|nr:hypothetical protein I302_04205 [Kwoniella bestiolae CBS 10118]OCF26519.1 hypothetical protein I302_04205 [Kwoniella bestiolae CBS 10118]
MQRGATGPFDPTPNEDPDDSTPNKRHRSGAVPLFPTKGPYRRTSSSSENPTEYFYLPPPSPSRPLGATFPQLYRSNDTQAPGPEKPGSSIPIAHPRPQRFATQPSWNGKEASPPGIQARFSSPVALNISPTLASRHPSFTGHPHQSAGLDTPLGLFIIDSPHSTEASSFVPAYRPIRQSSAKASDHVGPRAISNFSQRGSSSILFPGVPDPSFGRDYQVKEAQEKVDRLIRKVSDANCDLETARRELHVMLHTGQTEKLRKQLANAKKQSNTLEKDYAAVLREVIIRKERDVEKLRGEHDKEMKVKDEKLRALKRQVRSMEMLMGELQTTALNPAHNHDSTLPSPLQNAKRSSTGMIRDHSALVSLVSTPIIKDRTTSGQSSVSLDPIAPPRTPLQPSDEGKGSQSLPTQTSLRATNSSRTRSSTLADELKSQSLSDRRDEIEWACEEIEHQMEFDEGMLDSYQDRLQMRINLNRFIVENVDGFKVEEDDVLFEYWSIKRPTQPSEGEKPAEDVDTYRQS